MSDGCFKNVFATIGCFTVLVLAALVAWNFRGDIADAYRSVVVRRSESSGSAPTVGRPSAEALRTAEDKEDAISRRGGPERVVLSADEMASLVEDRLTPEARRALDSIAVILERNRFSLEAALLTDVFGRDLLGPLRGMIDPRESIRVSGPAEVRSPGVIGWEIDEFVVASVPFPGPLVPALVDRLTGGSGGIILIAVPAEAGDLRIQSDGVTFYRRVN